MLRANQSIIQGIGKCKPSIPFSSKLFEKKLIMDFNILIGWQKDQIIWRGSIIRSFEEQAVNHPFPFRLSYLRKKLTMDLNILIGWRKDQIIWCGSIIRSFEEQASVNHPFPFNPFFIKKKVCTLRASGKEKLDVSQGFVTLVKSDLWNGLNLFERESMRSFWKAAWCWSRVWILFERLILLCIHLSLYLIIQSRHTR